jgi:hypothetical protein
MASSHIVTALPDVSARTLRYTRVNRKTETHKQFY